MFMVIRLLIAEQRGERQRGASKRLGFASEKEELHSSLSFSFHCLKLSYALRTAAIKQ